MAEPFLKTKLEWTNSTFIHEGAYVHHGKRWTRETKDSAWQLDCGVAQMGKEPMAGLPIKIYDTGEIIDG